MKYIDNFLNSITMYKLVLYALLLLTTLAVIFGFIGTVSFSGLSLIISFILVSFTCYLSNILFGYLFKVPLNAESSEITALILFLIVTPPTSFYEAALLVLVCLVAMASKYVLNIGGKHIFNPAAIAVLVLGFFGIANASWWVASLPFFLPLIIVSLLIVRKIRRADLFISFLVVGFIAGIVTGLRFGVSFTEMSWQLLTAWPLLFLGGVMLTEPQTTPPTRGLRIVYGTIVGVLFGSAFNFGFLHNTPELALVFGNIYSYLVSPKVKLTLKLKEKLQLAPSIYDFVFKVDKKFAFQAGQYMEWSLGQQKPDSRGNRRYFTIASSPTEAEVHLGAKFYEPASSFKKALLDMKQEGEMVISQLAGDFVLPSNINQKCVFIAGGIGVTPFRSMVKYSVDTNQKRPMVLFYSARNYAEAVYKEIFSEAENKLGMKTVYAFNDTSGMPEGFAAHIGLIDKSLIEKEVPDFKECIFYISGPRVMVDAFKKTLLEMGVSRLKIKTDFFPGYA